jgi:hypothetical protein
MPCDDPEVHFSKNPVTIESAEAATRTGRLGDMKASSFWLLLGLISIIVIGVTVGGAVGGGVATAKNRRAATVAQAVTTGYSVYQEANISGKD